MFRALMFAGVVAVVVAAQDTVTVQDNPYKEFSNTGVYGKHQDISTYVGHACGPNPTDAEPCPMQKLPRSDPADLKAHAKWCEERNWKTSDCPKWQDVDIDTLVTQHAATGLPYQHMTAPHVGLHSQAVTRSGLTVNVGSMPGRWDDAQSNTITSPGTYDHRHMFMPEQKFKYIPQKDCCKRQCSAEFQVGSHKHTGCEYGCELWLSKSSLNWDGPTWWGKLETKCKKDCDAKRAHTVKPSYTGSSVFEEDFFKNLTPRMIQYCDTGCNRYKVCVEDYKAEV